MALVWSRPGLSLNSYTLTLKGFGASIQNRMQPILNMSLVAVKTYESRATWIFAEHVYLSWIPWEVLEHSLYHYRKSRITYCKLLASISEGAIELPCFACSIAITSRFLYTSWRWLWFEVSRRIAMWWSWLYLYLTGRQFTCLPFSVILCVARVLVKLKPML